MNSLALVVSAALVIGACSPSSDAPADASLGDGAPDAPSECIFCGDSGPLDASLATRMRYRLDSCSGNEGCHVSGAANLGYPAGHEFDQLIDVPSYERPALFRVKPGDPGASYLYLKVIGDGGIEGGRMPPSEPYDPAIPALVYAWIEAGAPRQ